jgi:hypothetical protein
MNSTVMADLSLAAWNRHADQLIATEALLASTVRRSPCKCGSCLRCRRLMQMIVDVKEARSDAVNRCNELMSAGAFVKTA